MVKMIGKKESGRTARYIFFFIVLLLDLAVLYPILNVLAVSFSSYAEYSANPMMVIPRGLNLHSYMKVFQNKSIWTGYANTLWITFAGTVLGVTVTVLAAYSLSKKKLKGKNVVMPIILFTMFFSGGMIPSYFLMRGLHLLDTRTALIIPGCILAYNLILVKNFFESLPESLMEAAEMDGASEPQILGRVVVPLSKPIISVIVLFTAVGYWNSYFNAILYTKSQSKWTLQLVLREIIMAANTMANATGGNLAEQNAEAVPAVMLQYASIVVAMVPILCVYPFIQKYFQEGIMMGAVKG